MPYTQQHVVSQGETPASSSYFNAEMTYIYNAINAEAANIAAHVADTEDAHDASAISVADTGGNFTGTNVEAVLAELHGDIAAHVNDTSAAHAASAISVLDVAENFTGTDVEAVLAEVQADLDGRFHTSTGHDHDGTDSAKIPESSLNLSDVTTGNASTAKHGFLPKLSGDLNQVLLGNGSWGAAPDKPYILILDKRPSGTNGGTSTSGGWYTRTLNTVAVDETGGVTLASNVFTLPAGTYRAHVNSMIRQARSAQIRLYNVTDGVTLVTGMSDDIPDGYVATGHATIIGQFTISASKQVRLEYQVEVGTSTVGLGTAASFGLDEIYTVVQLWKVG